MRSLFLTYNVNPNVSQLVLEVKVKVSYIRKYGIFLPYLLLFPPPRLSFVDIFAILLPVFLNTGYAFLF